jgi:hypothetical protein
MIHQSQRLAFCLEAPDDGLGIHAQLNDFEGDLAADGFFLLSEVHDTAATFTDDLKYSVPANAFPDFDRFQGGVDPGLTLRCKPYSHVQKAFWAQALRGGFSQFGTAFRT